MFLKYFNYKSAGSRNKKLISSAITRAEILADAMEIKGYNLETKKTRFREYFFTKLDFILLFDGKIFFTTAFKTFAAVFGNSGCI